MYNCTWTNPSLKSAALPRAGYQSFVSCSGGRGVLFNGARSMAAYVLPQFFCANCIHQLVYHSQFQANASIQQGIVERETMGGTRKYSSRYTNSGEGGIRQSFLLKGRRLFCSVPQQLWQIWRFRGFSTGTGAETFSHSSGTIQTFYEHHCRRRGCGVGHKDGKAAIWKQAARGMHVRGLILAGAAVFTDSSRGGDAGSWCLQRGSLLEFEGEDGDVCVGVATRRSPKRNRWIVVDQYGNQHAVKDAKVRHVVVSGEERGFTPADVVSFVAKAKAVEDPSLLESVWMAVTQEKVASVSCHEIAEMIYTTVGPLESYATHRMLSLDKKFFLLQKGRYIPRSQEQVALRGQQEEREQLLEKEWRRYVDQLLWGGKQPYGRKPGAEAWRSTVRFGEWTEALEQFALSGPERPVSKEHKDVVGKVCRMLRMIWPATPQQVEQLLISAGVWDRHFNTAFHRSIFARPFPEEALRIANALETGAASVPDVDEDLRVDLRHLRVFTIDSADTLEVDDGISVESLDNGKFRIGIHIADPARFMAPGSIIEREARERTRSLYLPTGVQPMIPLALAAGQMSLNVGRDACALSVLVELDAHHSKIEAVQLCNSLVRPSFRLTFEEANASIGHSGHLPSHADLRTLSHIAENRFKWRNQRGAVAISLPQMFAKVHESEEYEDGVCVSLQPPASPNESSSQRLVEEMMLLCNEGVAKFGSEHEIPLLYRGQAYAPIPSFQHLPENVCRQYFQLGFMGKVVVRTTTAVPHAALGLHGYVQFSSPIRRYTDLLCHYNVKAFLRGSPFPFSPTDLSSLNDMAKERLDVARSVERSSHLYWLLEHVAAAAAGKAAVYEATVVAVKDYVTVVLIDALALETTLPPQVKNLQVGDEVEVALKNPRPRLGTVDTDFLRTLNRNLRGRGRSYGELIY